MFWAYSQAPCYFQETLWFDAGLGQNFPTGGGREKRSPLKKPEKSCPPSPSQGGGGFDRKLAPHCFESGPKMISLF